MNFSEYIDETVQQAQDFINEDYLIAVGLTKPSKLVFERSIELFLRISRKINKMFPNDNRVELLLSEDGKMIISWHSNDFSKKYYMVIYDTVENDERKLKVELNKNFEL